MGHPPPPPRDAGRSAAPRRDLLPPLSLPGVCTDTDPRSSYAAVCSGSESAGRRRHSRSILKINAESIFEPFRSGRAEGLVKAVEI